MSAINYTLKEIMKALKCSTTEELQKKVGLMTAEEINGAYEKHMASKNNETEESCET